MPFLPSRVPKLCATAMLVAVCLSIHPCRVLAQGTNPPANSGAIEYTEEMPSPSGQLRLARPTLTWKISPQGTCRVTSVTLTLNGQAIPNTRYDATKKAVVGTPDSPLRAGRHLVRCKLTLNGDYVVEKEWEFSVAATAVSRVSSPDEVQAALCAEINAVRRNLSLPPLLIDDRLCAAASGHSDYLSSNREVGHTEAAGKSGFVAASTGDRVNAFGYDGMCYETISKGIPAALSAVHGLLDAPYHRAPFLQPGATEIGAGVQKDVVTLLFGAGDITGVVTYPSSGQKDVPTTWSGNETPNPLRLHKGAAAQGPTGYVITFFAFGPDNPQLNVMKATLTTDKGQAVPFFLNTPANDEFLKNGAFLIPCQPLRPATTYRVSVTASDDAGVSLSRTWNFTTASAASTVKR